MGKAKLRHIFIGTSGFSYKHWMNGVFYPAGLPTNEWFSYYTQHFNTVELNVSFYRLPSVEAYKNWYRTSPQDFTFAAKGSRFITHIKRLNDCRGPLKIYFDRARHLNEKLKVILWQLPPRFKKDLDRLDCFTKELKRYAAYQHAFEFRDESWLTTEVVDLLAANNFSICKADYPEFKTPVPDTADFVYVRRHGHSHVSYEPSCYSNGELRGDARLIRTFVKSGKDVFVYYNNDPKGYAVENALTLKHLLNV